VKLQHIPAIGGLVAVGIIGSIPVTVVAVQAAEQAKSAITEEASAALLRMGQTLRSEQFSFPAKTIRVYSDAGGEPLHIFHTMKVTVRRPNRVLVDVTGDDGSNKLVFDGKTLTIYSAQDKKYATASVPEGTTIDGMLKDAVGRFGIDFPLADFLSEAPNKAFLSGITSGRIIKTVTIDGAPYDHLFFFQPPGIELELWLPKTEQAVPRRLIVTYRTLPGQPGELIHAMEAAAAVPVRGLQSGSHKTHRWRKADSNSRSHREPNGRGKPSQAIIAMSNLKLGRPD
jgi:hypothetical protein